MRANHSQVLLAEAVTAERAEKICRDSGCALAFTAIRIEPDASKGLPLTVRVGESMIEPNIELSCHDLVGAPVDTARGQ
jgi:hypothetical protein